MAARDAPGAHPAALAAGRSARWPARCSASSSARSGRTTAARRRRSDRGGSAPMPSRFTPRSSPSRSAPPVPSRRSSVAASSAWLAVALAGRATSRMSQPGCRARRQRPEASPGSAAGPGCGRPRRRVGDRSRSRTWCRRARLRTNRALRRASERPTVRSPDGREVARGAQHLGRRAHARSIGDGRRQTVSFLRPLARRAASTRRPPLVFMRARKPCSLARCRFLG